MSIPFNQNTASIKGLVQFFEKEIGANYGDVSGNSEVLGEFISRANVALDDFTKLAINSSGTWQWDDTSTYETDGSTERGYPILKAHLVSGKRDYKFVQDDAGNLILDIHKVLILPSATATDYVEISPIDELREPNNILKNSTSGIPNRYGKLSNGLFLEPPTSYSVNNGFKLVVSREASYFTANDTTKKAGIPGIFHKYLYLKPAYEVASIKGLSNLPQLEKKILDLEGSKRLGIVGEIEQYFSMREKDVKKGLRQNVENCR